MAVQGLVISRVVYLLSLSKACRLLLRGCPCWKDS